MTPEAQRDAEELQVLTAYARAMQKGIIHLPEEDARRAVEIFELCSELLRQRIEAGL